MDKKTAFEELLERNRGRMVAISRTYAPREADDLLQEILLQVWRALGSFEHRSSIDTWCYRVALNTAISWRRSAGTREQRLPGELAAIDQLAACDRGHDHTELLQKFLQTLSEGDRALVLMYLEDMSGAEMAEVIGISEAAVRVRIHRIKKRLAQWEAGEL